MKILFFTTPHEDGLSDVLYNGLVKNGIEVVDYPRKPFYHCSNNNGEISAYDNQGDKVIEDSNGNLTLPNGIKSHRKFITVSKDYGNQTEEPFDEDYELVVVSSINAQNKQLFERIRNQKKVPFVFLDGRDDPFLLKAIKEYEVYFKRELYADSFSMIKKALALKKLGFSYYRKLSTQTAVSIPHTFFNFFNPKLVKKNIISLNLSINAHNFKKHNGDKEYDFCFISSPNTPYRIKISKILEKFASRYDLKVFLNLKKFENDKDPRIPWLDFVDIIQKSKMAISLPGVGFDTFRYWEIPYYGTCLVSPYLPIEILNNFKDMQSAIFFSNISQLEKKILNTLKDDSWENIAMEGHKKFNEYHSSEQRARRFIENL